MCDRACIDFGKNLTREMVEGKRVVEVGSLDINGSLRTAVMAMEPAIYIGCDITLGKGVDVRCNVEDLVKNFNVESFDLVISTEMLEHVQDWRRAIYNIKAVTKTGGHILITTRSKGFSKHNHPFDFWRFEEEDMRRIFADCEILKTEKDMYAPGIFILARLPKDFKECSLDKIKPYEVK